MNKRQKGNESHLYTYTKKQIIHLTKFLNRNTINIKLYDILRKDFNLSETKAKEFAEAIQNIAQDEVKGNSMNYKSELGEDILKLEIKLREDILKLEIKSEQNKSELLKWFIGMFIALALMIIGLYIKK